MDFADANSFKGGVWGGIDETNFFLIKSSLICRGNQARPNRRIFRAPRRRLAETELHRLKSK